MVKNAFDENKIFSFRQRFQHLFTKTLRFCHGGSLRL
jgi:hypothetical protein